jgi:hypothetical protein
VHFSQDGDKALLRLLFTLFQSAGIILPYQNPEQKGRGIPMKKRAGLSVTYNSTKNKLMLTPPYQPELLL